MNVNEWFSINRETFDNVHQITTNNFSQTPLLSGWQVDIFSSICSVSDFSEFYVYSVAMNSHSQTPYQAASSHLHQLILASYIANGTVTRIQVGTLIT